MKRFILEESRFMKPVYEPMTVFERKGRGIMMKKMVSQVLILALALMAGLTGCKKAPEPQGSEVSKIQEQAGKDAADPGEESEQVTISIHPSGHGLPVYIAQEKGWFEEEGLDVETLVYISAPPQMEAYSSGAWEIGTTGFGGIILGVAKNDLKVIGVSIDDATVMGLWARNDSDLVSAGPDEKTGIYGTAEEWKGKEILLAQGTITDVLLTATLEELGLKDDDVVRTNMDASTAYTAFNSGSGDMVQANASFYFNALKEDWTAVTTGESRNLFMPSAIIASDKIIKERPETVEKFTRVYMKAVEWIRENPEEAAELFVDFCDDNGVATEYDNALQFVNMQIVKIPDVAGQMELFEKADGSDKTRWQESLGRLMDYYITMGNYTQEDKDLLLKDENYVSTFMKGLE